MGLARIIEDAISLKRIDIQNELITVFTDLIRAMLNTQSQALY